MSRMIWLLINIMSWVFFLMPTFFIKFIFRAADVFDGKIGALIRIILIKKKLKKCGDFVYIGPRVFIDHFSELEIGSFVSIHQGSNLLTSGGVVIGCNVSIAHDCSLVSGNHTWDDNKIPIRDNPVMLEPVTICDDVWIGCGVRILAGTYIQQRVIVAAGAVARGVLESGSIYGGVPSKLIGKM